jgi:hypothetical protein
MRVYARREKEMGRDFSPAKWNNSSKAPSPYDFKMLPGVMGDVSRSMQDDKLSRKPTRDKDGFIDPRTVDLNDPKDFAEYKRAIDAGFVKQQQIMKDNNSIMPRWIRGSDSAEQYDTAEVKLIALTAARTEIAMFEKDQKAYQDKLARQEKQEPKPDLRVARGAEHQRKRETGPAPVAVTVTARAEQVETQSTPASARLNVQDDVVADGGVKSSNGTTPALQATFEAASGGNQTSATVPAIATDAPVVENRQAMAPP